MDSAPERVTLLWVRPREGNPPLGEAQRRLTLLWVLGEPQRRVTLLETYSTTPRVCVARTTLLIITLLHNGGTRKESLTGS